MKTVARLVLAALLTASGQALSLAAPPPSTVPAEVGLFLLRVLLVSSAALPATLPRFSHARWAAAGTGAGALVLWAMILVRRDAHEVGTVGAILEGLLIGGAIALPGIALFLVGSGYASRGRLAS